MKPKLTIRIDDLIAIITEVVLIHTGVNVEEIIKASRLKEGKLLTRN